MKAVRCAIYTRKSSEEGLEQSGDLLQRSAQRIAVQPLITALRVRRCDARLTRPRHTHHEHDFRVAPRLRRCRRGLAGPAQCREAHIERCKLLLVEHDLCGMREATGRVRSTCADDQSEPRRPHERASEEQ